MCQVGSLCMLPRAPEGVRGRGVGGGRGQQTRASGSAQARDTQRGKTEQTRSRSARAREAFFPRRTSVSRIACFPSPFAFPHGIGGRGVCRLSDRRVFSSSSIFFPTKSTWFQKPAADHAGRPRVDRRSTRGGAALELDLGLPDSPQAGRGFVVGQRAVKPLLLVWNRCFSVLLASEVPSQAAHGAMPADPTRGSIGSTKTMSGARFCEHRVWVSCCILARSMRAHANDSQCCC